MSSHNFDGLNSSERITQLSGYFALTNAKSLDGKVREVIEEIRLMVSDILWCSLTEDQQSQLIFCIHD